MTLISPTGRPVKGRGSKLFETGTRSWAPCSPRTSVKTWHEPTGNFLGLEFSPVTADGIVAFWVRARLHKKIEDMLATAKLTGVLPAGVAAKLYGILNFLELGIYGRVGTGGLQALGTQGTTDGDLSDLAMRPRRRVEVLPLQHHCFVAVRCSGRRTWRRYWWIPSSLAYWVS